MKSNNHNSTLNNKNAFGGARPKKEFEDNLKRHIKKYSLEGQSRVMQLTHYALNGGIVLKPRKNLLAKEQRELDKWTKLFSF